MCPKVTLDLTYYYGDDLYSDGDVEKKLLDIVTAHTKDEYNRIIRDEKDWAVMYHLSDMRANIISAFPISKDQAVLEIGAGCGAITGALADKAKSVTCIELSKLRSTINAYKNAEYENIEIKVGDFRVIEQALPRYDIIMLIGVFEYSGLYCSTADSHDPFATFMQMVAKHVKPDGRVYLAIENKYGMKYFSGFREDHYNRTFIGIEGYPQDASIKTFSKPELLAYFEQAGFSDLHWYYPYPDYKFPEIIYSDEYLPKGKIDYETYAKNFDSPRINIFNERIATENAIRSQCFPMFSNSFLIEMRGCGH